MKALAWAAALALAAATSVQAAPAPRPQRIVSFNACADGYLMALADKDQIAALTQFARDPAYSAHPEQARAYPYTQGQAEAVLALHPDLVIASPYRRAESLALLRGRTRILDLKPAKSFDDVVKQTRMIAAAIGQGARGEALVRSMQARVDAAGRRPPGGVAAHYERGGILIGTGSLMDDLMTRAGLTNLARKLHKGALGQMSLEQIVYARPDYLVLTDEAGHGQDEGSQMLDHPALMRAVPASHRLHVPAALTVCGGPSYPDALERLQAEADRARAGR
jgi:iron complex transport system substrate-binding protein